MLFEITHLTRYIYDRPVVLEPLTIRLRPRCDIFQRVVSFDLKLEPAPEGMSEMIDVEGNAVAQAWFLGSSSLLGLRTTCTVETLQSNPFDYIVLDPDGLAVPMSYSGADRLALAPYLVFGGDRSVEAFARDVLHDTGGATAFLGELSTRIAGSIAYEVREFGEPLPAGTTLSRGSGACRDLAVLFIEACRSVGIAARFVTGYEVGDAANTDRDLHAWAEVFLKGAGWRGYDPSQGLAVADRHVTVATGPSYVEAAPTAGTFRGNDVASTLETMISVRVPTYSEAAYQSAARRPLARVVGFAPPMAGTT